MSKAFFIFDPIPHFGTDISGRLCSNVTNHDTTISLGVVLKPEGLSRWEVELPTTRTEMALLEREGEE